MSELKELFQNNREWARRKVELEPEFFRRLANQQSPRYLWIGCSDSRVPANEIVDLLPGELFVHRNVANLVVHSDLNCLSVLQYAVEVLRVEHVIVTGHYGCGGVAAALAGRRLGLIDNWLRHVKDVRYQHAGCIDCLPAGREQEDRLCELNVIEQVVNVSWTSVVQEAWDRGQRVQLHGWVYSLADGLLRDLGMTGGSREEIERRHSAAIAALRGATAMRCEPVGGA